MSHYIKHGNHITKTKGSQVGVLDQPLNVLIGLFYGISKYILIRYPHIQLALILWYFLKNLKKSYCDENDWVNSS